ncbi:MAG: hemerythrin domain-containing protein [Flavobacteriales bacterium]|nr:hemerythrin domain-containing protein [Flavobacteriales bacterium]
MANPIKRSASLKPLSREHHDGLLLSLKIRKGIKQNVELKRIKRYTDWFWKHHLQAHFEFEEKYIFPILGQENELIIKALQEHSRLKQLFTATTTDKQNLSSIEKELVSHIRYEERVLFNEIESIASEHELEIIEKEHSKNIVDEWEDKFWTIK